MRRFVAFCVSETGSEITVPTLPETARGLRNIDDLALFQSYLFLWLSVIKLNLRRIDGPYLQRMLSPSDCSVV